MAPFNIVSCLRIGTDSSRTQSCTSSLLILVPIALFSSYSRWSLGTRMEGLWRHTDFPVLSLSNGKFDISVELFTFTMSLKQGTNFSQQVCFRNKECDKSKFEPFLKYVVSVSFCRWLSVYKKYN